MVIEKGIDRESQDPGKQQLGGLVASAKHEVEHRLAAIHQPWVMADLAVFPQEQANKDGRRDDEDQLALIQGQPGRSLLPECHQAAVLEHGLHHVHQSHSLSC